MKKTHAIFFTVIVAAVLLMQYDLSNRSLAVQSKRIQQAAVLKSAPVAVSKPAVKAADTKPAVPFIDKFKTEALQIAKIQTRPEEAEVRMRDLARQMKPQDVDSMFELISNDKNDGDQRALAVELLSVKNDTTSLIALQNFVANNVNTNGKKWDRKKEFETILRAQAVESIATYPQKEIALSTLSYLQRKVDNSFLADRIGRATAQITLNARSPQQQDEQALKKLVQ